MTYVPADPSLLVPGLLANRFVTQLVTSLDAAVALHQVPILNSRCSLAVESVSATQVAEFVIPGNLDNRDIQLIIFWRGTTGQTAAMKFVVDDGVVDDDVTITSTTSSYAIDTATLPLVNTTGPLRRGRIFLSCTSAALTRVAHVLCLIPKLPSGLPDGVRPSGIAKLAGWDLSSTGGAWPSEVVERMTGNVRSCARDLRACLVSGLHRYGASGRPNYAVTGATYKLVDRFVWPGGDPDRRRYRLSCNLQGDAPRMRLQVGPYDVEVGASGWSHELPTFFAPQGSQGFVWVRSASAGTARLETYQLFREPT